MRKVILSLALLAIGYMNLDNVKSIETVVENKSELETIEENKSELQTRNTRYYPRWCTWYQKQYCKRYCHRNGMFLKKCKINWEDRLKCECAPLYYF